MQHVVLPLRDLVQNIIILGGTGSGKTTGGVSPIVSQLLDLDCGLIFDVKGDYHDVVQQLAAATGKTVVEIGVDAEPINLIVGLTPEIAASFIRSALLLSGPPGDPFWLDAPTELVRNGLGILSHLGDERYNLDALYCLIFTPDAEAIIADAQQQLTTLDAGSRAARSLPAYLNYLQNVHPRFDINRDIQLQRVDRPIGGRIDSQRRLENIA